MEGVVFDVQYHTQRTGTHGDMIGSNLHGSEEPIKWLLGWHRQDNFMMSHFTRKNKDVLTQDALAEPGLGGSPTADGMIAFY
jgi:hypothetical protein